MISGKMLTMAMPLCVCVVLVQILLLTLNCGKKIFVFESEKYSEKNLTEIIMYFFVAHTSQVTG